MCKPEERADTNIQTKKIAPGAKFPGSRGQASVQKGKEQGEAEGPMRPLHQGRLVGRRRAGRQRQSTQRLWSPGCAWEHESPTAPTKTR